MGFQDYRNYTLDNLARVLPLASYLPLANVTDHQLKLLGSGIVPQVHKLELEHKKTNGKRTLGPYSMRARVRFDKLTIADDVNGSISTPMLSSDGNIFRPIKALEIFDEGSQIWIESIFTALVNGILSTVKDFRIKISSYSEDIEELRKMLKADNLLGPLSYIETMMEYIKLTHPVLYQETPDVDLKDFKNNYIPVRSGVEMQLPILVVANSYLQTSQNFINPPTAGNHVYKIDKTNKIFTENLFPNFDPVADKLALMIVEDNDLGIGKYLLFNVRKGYYLLRRM